MTDRTADDTTISLTATGCDTAASIGRRYYYLIASAFLVDMVIATIFMGLSGAWYLAPRIVLSSLIVLVGANLLLARWQFAPIARFLRTGENFSGIERRMTQLPLQSARNVAILTFLLLGFRIGSQALFGDGEQVGTPTILDAVMTVLLEVVFFFVLVYFIVSDYLAGLGQFIFERHGHNLGLYFGRFSTKLAVALLVSSVLPIVLILVDIYSYDGERARTEVLVDASAALFGLTLAIIFVTRSLIRPVVVLNRGIGEVAEGRLDVRLPVTSNDEFGRLTSEFNRMVEGLQDREFVRETFGKYVSESVATQILKDKGRLAGDVREATLMFIDIQGFTTLSEQLPPHDVIALLNEYSGIVSEPVRRHDGVINNFIGDGVFATFNLPLEHDDHACAAVRAALEISEAVEKHVFAGGVRISVRIGINTGEVVAGTVGAGDRLTYAILGDAVNVAHRVEELNKELGSRLLFTESTRARLDDSFDCAELGIHPIRGKSASMKVFTIKGRG
ncbi:MAG: adenylate/guanylate cyclase domain-containing protein [Reyranellaceae bacterium]